MTLSITLIGGPTALIEIDGFRLLTDPTFDPPGAYQLPHVKLEKLAGPALTPDKIGNIDAVLLSHDQHADNLDDSGKEFLKVAKRVLTTEAGAKRLGGKAEGFAPWEVTEVAGKNGHALTITATPARSKSIASFGVMPRPPATFSPFTTTKSITRSFFRMGTVSITARRPGSPTRSPRNKILSMGRSFEIPAC